MSPGIAKVFWLIVNPANILTALLVLGVLLRFTRRRRTGRVLALVATAPALRAHRPSLAGALGRCPPRGHDVRINT